MSFTELLNSRIPFPSEEPISGRRLAPNRSSTMRKMKIISPIPNPPRPIFLSSSGAPSPPRSRGSSDPRADEQRHDRHSHQGEDVQLERHRPQRECNRDQIHRQRPYRGIDGGE